MNYDNLKFPKQGKKKRKKPKPGKYPCERQKESIIPGDKKGRCYICGSHVNIQNHHIFFGNGNRKNSDYCGLTVHLCLEHHKEGKMSAHKNREVNYRLKVILSIRRQQKKFEIEDETYNKVKKAIKEKEIENEE